MIIDGINRTRGFEKISAYKDIEFPLPQRKTELSAGYDFSVPQSITLEPNKITVVPTGVKAYMQNGEWLGIHIRSSMAIKKGIFMVNNIGVIDADYYNNEDNEGHIMVALMNTTDKPITLEKDTRIAQGIFYNYLKTDDDKADGKRVGGIGSTK